MRRPHRLLHALAAIAALKVLVGLLGVLFVEADVVAANLAGGGAFSAEVSYLMGLVFAGGASLLLFGASHDLRAIALGGFFLCSSGAFLDRPLRWLLHSGSPLPDVIVKTVHWIPYSALMPYLLWLFFSHFPRVQASEWSSWVLRVGKAAGIVVSVVILVMNLPLGAEIWFPGYVAPSVCHEFIPHSIGTYHDRLVFALFLGALSVGLWRSRLAEITERRRVRVLVAGLVAGLAPVAIDTLLEDLIPGLKTWMETGDNRRIVGLTVIFPPLFMIPFTTAYAVLVHRVLDVRLIAWKALQYALAQYTVRILAVVPLAGLAMNLYVRRQETLEAIFSGTGAILLASTAAVGVFLLFRRQVLLDWVDRKFFREHWDARQILTPLVERIRNTGSRRELADLVCNGIDRALHLETIALLVEVPERGELVDPAGRIRPIALSANLVSMVAASREPLDVDLEIRPRAFPNLSQEDRDWIVDGDFRLLVPIVKTDGTLLGIIALGEKKSSLPILREDRQLVSAIANSAALALEVQSLRPNRAGSGSIDTGEVPLPTSSPAQECFGCGRLYLPHNQVCPSCNRELEAALVPYVMPGRFRFESRIGAGGMGVVYRAVDLSLSRPVAVKTMRKVSIDDAQRLRREARAAAAVSHPNLSLIYVVESWQGNPMLVMEFLEGGTLADRLLDRPLGIVETLELGIALSAALDKLHAANILHRDLKPSNIGYSRDGTPKLMDFGIARVLFDLRREAPGPTEGPTAISGFDSMGWVQPATPATASRQLVGTLHYLSPEALDAQRPEPSFDLWSLNVVLLECLTGRRVFQGSMRDIMTAIRKANIPDLNGERPDSPKVLRDFFRNNLHLDLSYRAATAALLRHQLEEVRRLL